MNNDINREEIHHMKLDPAPYEMIKSGSKTTELRLFDEKRRRINPGDMIVFTNNETGESTVNLAHKMEYIHPVYEKSDVVLVPYSSDYQEQYRKIYNECYHEMREALNIKPFDFIQDDSFFKNGMEDVYLLLEGEDLIGSVALKGNEIDDLIVSPYYQGRGYGKKILLWAMDNIKSERIFLHVADWNKRAIGLYKKYGFEIVETEVIG